LNPEIGIVAVTRITSYLYPKEKESRRCSAGGRQQFIFTIWRVRELVPEASDERSDRNEPWAVLVSYSTDERGELKTQGTHGREGETGQDVSPEGKKGGTLSSPTVSTKLQRIAEQAVREPKRVFTTLAHLIDIDVLKEAFHRARKDAAPGVDGVVCQEPRRESP
jgi:hypothetical protein